MKPDPKFLDIVGFEWDRGNIEKNKVKHGVSNQECEEAFFNHPVHLFDDKVHSGIEERYGILGKTNVGKRIAVAFTIRGSRVRVISARPQSKKDRLIYSQAERNSLGEVKN